MRRKAIRPSGRLLTREQILAMDDRPEKVRRLDGRPGRKPKWSLGDIEPERAIALAVELERRRRGIPNNRPRTPNDIFKSVAKSKASSPRSARRFYRQHRDHARQWAEFLIALAPTKHVYRDLLKLYGEGVGDLPADFGDRILQYREQLKPSDIPRFDDWVKSIVGQKVAKTG